MLVDLAYEQGQAVRREQRVVHRLEDDRVDNIFNLSSLQIPPCQMRTPTGLEIRNAADVTLRCTTDVHRTVKK